MVVLRCYFRPDVFCVVFITSNLRVTGTGVVASSDVSGLPWAFVDELAHERVFPYPTRHPTRACQRDGGANHLPSRCGKERNINASTCRSKPPRELLDVSLSVLQRTSGRDAARCAFCRGRGSFNVRLLYSLPPLA